MVIRKLSLPRRLSPYPSLISPPTPPSSLPLPLPHLPPYPSLIPPPTPPSSLSPLPLPHLSPYPSLVSPPTPPSSLPLPLPRLSPYPSLVSPPTPPSSLSLHHRAQDTDGYYYDKEWHKCQTIVSVQNIIVIVHTVKCLVVACSDVCKPVSSLTDVLLQKLFLQR